jgi:uncharacterized protein (TIGR00661 family)
LETANLGHYSVYLPAYDDKTLIKCLGKNQEIQWQVFSKREKKAYRINNVEVMPINNETFNKSLATGEGLLTGGGFEGPAEALYLQKKVLMIPMKGQYEQQCNALAASRLGVKVVPAIDEDFAAHINQWVNEDKTISVNFPDETAQIVDDMIKRYAKPGLISA